MIVVYIFRNGLQDKEQMRFLQEFLFILCAFISKISGMTAGI